MADTSGTVEVDGETFQWVVTVEGGVRTIEVSGRGDRETTQVGGSEPEVLASMLAREIVARRKRSG